MKISPLLFFGIAASGLLGGCATGSSARWFAPATWFSHAPANAVDAATQRQAEASKQAVKLAQKATHETEIALAAAPASRPASVATESNNNAIALLDQVAGPLTASELAEIRKTVAGLLSDNAKLRADAEQARLRTSDEVTEVSGQLAKAQSKLDTAEKNLRAGFERENALADELRSAHALHWILGGVAVLCLAGWVYVRFFLGGIPGALGGALKALESTHPEIAGTIDNPGPVRLVLNQLLNRHEQALVKTAYINAK